MDKRPLVVWSGGFDSTILVGSTYDKRETIDTIYIELENNPAQSKAELAARNKIRALFEKSYPSFNTEITKWHVKVPMIREKYCHGSAQPLAWLSTLVMLSRKETSEIQFGYVQNDQFWHFKHDFERAFYHLWKVANAGTPTLEPPKLTYPLEWNTKEELAKRWYGNSKLTKELFKLVWTCDAPKGDMPKSCGKCNKCKEYKQLKDIVDATN